MIKKNISELNKLYESFQYKSERVCENYAVFSLGDGIYPGVDIITAGDMGDDEFQKIRAEFSDAGYATNRVVFTSLEQLETALFEKFFKPAQARGQLQLHYQRYIENIMRPYTSSDGVVPKYKYIEVLYTYEEDFKTIGQLNAKLVDKLYQIIQEDKTRLIIVEAPAGFGKTSTAYELVERLCTDDTLKRPFFMELAKDRTAPTFRYLLLSQIEKNFQIQLKNEIVIRHIKSGRIPLIIDGFDELLSKDLDNEFNKVRFEEVETMLSTIAELLTENSKVILTTRKTAIFSGERFLEWFFAQQDKGIQFSVSRFQLMEPTPTDWLSVDKINLLPRNISSINNPVLLSYLRYIPEESLTEFSDPDKLVKSYFDFLFKREMERQSLPFKVSEQHDILANLAAYFAALDITADNRSDVLDAILVLSKGCLNEYSSSDRDERSLANTLTNHALLDRHSSGKVGFINDYVFGSLLGWAFVNNSAGIELVDTITNRIADKLLKACAIWNLSNRQILAKALFRLDNRLNQAVLFRIDQILLGKFTRSFRNLNFSDEEIVDISFNDNALWEECTFTKCSFKDSTLDFSKIKNCTFIACSFQNVKLEGEVLNCYFYDGNPFEQRESNENAPSDVECESTQITMAIDEKILSAFYRKGSQITRINKISTIIDSLINDFERKDILKRIERLVANGFIITNGDNAWIKKVGSEHLNNLRNC